MTIKTHFAFIVLTVHSRKSTMYIAFLDQLLHLVLSKWLLGAACTWKNVMFLCTVLLSRSSTARETHFYCTKCYFQRMCKKN
jgi:hypothetical protein